MGGVLAERDWTYRPYQDQAESDLKRIVTVCHHGEQDSWSNKAIIEDCGYFQGRVDVIARGVEPRKAKPTEYEDGTTRAIPLTLEEIKAAHALVIHNSNLQIFRVRFGGDFANQLIAAGKLHVRTGREAQFTSKDTGRTRANVKAVTKDCEKKIRAVLNEDKTIGEIMEEGLFVAAAKNETDWQAKKNEKQNKGKRRR